MGQPQLRDRQPSSRLSRAADTTLVIAPSHFANQLPADDVSALFQRVADISPLRPVFRLYVRLRRGLPRGASCRSS